MYPTAATTPIQDDPYFHEVRRTSVSVLLTVVGVHLLLKVVFFSSAFLHRVALPLEQLTKGFVSPSVVTGLVSIVVIVGAIMMLLGSLRPSDLGFTARSLSVGLGVFVLLVLAAHGFGLVVAVATDTTIETVSYPSGQVVASIADAFLGAAVGEEVLYRGFLLVQVHLLLADRTRLERGSCLVIAIVITQAYFGVNHLASAMRMGLPPAVTAGYISQAALVGTMLAVLFIRTGTIAAPIVAHGILNMPSIAFRVPVDGKLLALIAVCLLMLALPYVYRKESRRFQFGLTLPRIHLSSAGDVTCVSNFRDDPGD